MRVHVNEYLHLLELSRSLIRCVLCGEYTALSTLYSSSAISCWVINPSWSVILCLFFAVLCSYISNILKLKFWMWLTGKQEVKHRWKLRLYSHFELQMNPYLYLYLCSSSVGLTTLVILSKAVNNLNFNPTRLISFINGCFCSTSILFKSQG